jgi:catechol 2,3-dioxygenase-like lactoylglutathione lyase family enzyme
VAPRDIVEQLDLVYYWTADMDRAVRFYRDILGLRLLRQDGDAWAQFDAGGRRFAIHGAGEGQSVTPGGATAVFSVTDLDRAKAALGDLGVQIVHEGDVEGFARFVSIRDPDDNTIELIEYAGPQPEPGSEGHRTG